MILLFLPLSSPPQALTLTSPLFLSLLFEKNYLTVNSKSNAIHNVEQQF